MTTDSVLSIEKLLDDVDGALERIRSGAYRSCDLCGAPIVDALLEREPLRTSCAQHDQLTS